LCFPSGGLYSKAQISVKEENWMGVTVKIKEGFGRPWSEALFPKLAQAVVEDPEYRAAFQANPLAAITSRFGKESLPAEGITVLPRNDGGYFFVLPPGEGVWVLDANLQLLPSLEDEELPDELLEFAGGDSATCQGPSGNSNKV
jgi:hypothetical protein